MTWEVRHGDAVALLREMAATSIDALVTDPPYGERAAAWDAPRGAAWYETWLAEAARVLKPGAPMIVCASRRYLDVVMGSMRRVLGDEPGRPLQTGAWVHRQGHPVRDGMLRPEHEPFVVSGNLRTTDDDVRALRNYQTPHSFQRKPTHRRANARGFKRFTYVPHEMGPMAGTIFECARNKPAEAVGHPTQKPLALMEYLVLIACPPGGIVLDPFCGSATTLLAALKHGRDALGFEREAAYVEMARRRIAGPLFAAVESSPGEGAS